MLRLRQCKLHDSWVIAKWIDSEETWLNWSGGKLDSFPIHADVIADKYFVRNGGCVENDNFYPWIVIGEDDVPVGHFIMRYREGKTRCIHFGLVIVDKDLRGKGYGKNMLQLGLRYAFQFLDADVVTLYVFVDNKAAIKCYESVGFINMKGMQREVKDTVMMAITKGRFEEVYNEI